MLLVLRAARLIVSSFAKIIHDGAVVVKDERIEWVGAWSDFEQEPNPLPIKDLGDVTLMPGLFDCHVHLQLDPSEMNTTEVLRTDDELLPLMAQNSLRLLDAGVTTVRDLGSRGMTAIILRDKIRRGEVPGPRVQCANAPLTVAGGHAYSMGGVCQGIEEVRREVRKRAAEGADLIKVMSTGGFMTAGSQPSIARFSLEEMIAIADEAKKCNLPVTTHALGVEGIERAADAKFNSIEHCAWITADGRAVFDTRVARKLVDNGIIVCPTMNTACSSHDYFCPWDDRGIVIGNLASLRKTGVKIIVGTDAGIGFCRFERYADGLYVLADAGYGPREIIAAATESAAHACGLSNITGKIQPGFSADLAAFAGNPLEDITAFSQPRFVMASGREHHPSPIAPIGDLSKVKNLAIGLLRKGAGLPYQ